MQVPELFLLPNYCDRTGGVPDHRDRYATHRSPPYPAAPSAAHHYQPDVQALGQVDALFVCSSQPQVRLLDGAPGLLDPSYLFVEKLSCLAL